MKVRTFDRTIRDKNKRYARVEIAGHTGYLTREFEYTMDAEWQPILNFNGKFQLLEDIGSLAGTPLFATGAFTRKFYRGGSYILLDIDFRIVDEIDGGFDSSPIVNATRTFAYACSPIDMTAEKAWELLGTTTKAVTTLADVGLEGTVNAVGAIFNKDTTVVGEGIAGAQKFGQTAGKIIDDFSNSGVQPVTVSVGDYIQNKPFIITSFTSKYSKEVTNRGPLYGDFSMSLSTREVYDRESIGSFFQTHNSRVSVS